MQVSASDGVKVNEAVSYGFKPSQGFGLLLTAKHFGVYRYTTYQQTRSSLSGLPASEGHLWQRTQTSGRMQMFSC